MPPWLPGPRLVDWLVVEVDLLLLEVLGCWLLEEEDIVGWWRLGDVECLGWSGVELKWMVCVL